jgi:hypothetical protein
MLRQTLPDHEKVDFIMNQRAVQFVMAFIAGFVSTLVFHQGVLALFYLAGALKRTPYDLGAVPPLGIPAVISLAFWGGVWGAAIWPLLMNVAGAAYWVRALVIGAIGPSAIALFLVFPLKGMPIAGGWDPNLIIAALILNGAWGVGMALLMRLLRHAPSRPQRS